MQDGPPLGPICEGEFRRYYYNPPEDSYSPRMLWRFEQQARLLDNLKSDTRYIAVLPKKIKELNMRDGNREVFWGLYAVEEVGFLWFVGYTLLCVSPGVIFFFLWLLQWQHASDLQNAVVPLALTFTFLALFRAILFGPVGRESKVHRD